MMLTGQRKFHQRVLDYFYEIPMQDIELTHCAKFHHDKIHFLAARKRQSWDFML